MSGRKIKRNKTIFTFINYMRLPLTSQSGSVGYWSFAGAFAAAMAVAVTAAMAAPTYQFTQLTPLVNDSQSYAHGLNDSGMVVGESDGSSSAAVYYNATGKPIPASLSAQALTGAPYASIAYAVNSSGQIVGSAQATSNDSAQAAYFLAGDSNNPHYLTNTLGATSSTAFGISNATSCGTMLQERQGEPTSSTAFGISNATNPIIVGQYNGSHAFYYTNGTMTAVDPANTPANLNSSAIAVNASGVLVGQDQSVGNGDFVAFEYDTASPGATPVRIFTAGEETQSGAANSQANAINDAGQIVGQTLMADGTTQAFLYSGSGEATALGFLPTGSYMSVALGINNAGQVVGYGDDDIDSQGLTHAFVDQNGVMQDLNDLIDPSLLYSTGHAGWTLTDAEAINNAGQIVGTAFYNNGTDSFTSGFLLTPLPEPTTSGVVLLGATMALLHRRRRGQAA